MNKKHTILYAMIFVIIFAATQIYTICQKCTDCFSFAESEEKEIYLTFDDGPSDRVTPKILDILKDEGVSATFFIVGEHARTRKYLIKREHDEGHCVAVHSYTHKYEDIYSSPNALIKDIDACNDVIEEVIGTRSRIYRFPGGSFTVKADLLAHVISKGMKYVDWNASTRDAEIANPTPYELYKAAIETPAYRQKIILLSHDSTDKLAVVYALKDIIRHYKEQGYIFKRF